MSAAILLIPFVLIRHVLLGLQNPKALRRAAYFPDRLGIERIFYWIYQICSILLILGLFILKVNLIFPWFYLGVITCGLGILLCIFAIIDFAKPQENGFNQNGVYRLSRNPMYIGYFIYFLGCVFITVSWFYMAVLVLFQLSAHFIIRSEERWCVKSFGDEYVNYMKKVRRYL